jgi:hypothetical protein
MVTNKRTDKEAADQAMFDGIKENAQSLTFVVVAGKQVPPADILAVLQKRLDSNRHVVTTRLVWQDAVKADRDERAQSQALVNGVRQSLQSAYADSADTLGKYGLKPRKPRVVSTDAKVAAAAKAKATRAARHTMGSKQKAQIKGTVEVPVTSLPASSQPGTPAASPAANPPVAAPPAAPVVATAPKPIG